MINFAKIRILTIGKVKKLWIKEGVSTYRKRLGGIQILELKESNQFKESDLISSSFLRNDTKVILSEEGSFFSSEDLADFLSQYKNQHISFAIGGPDGLTTDLKNNCDLILSLSKLTFPHEIALLLLLEQIYRSHSILSSHPYHRR